MPMAKLLEVHHPILSCLGYIAKCWPLSMAPQPVPTALLALMCTGDHSEALLSCEGITSSTELIWQPLLASFALRRPSQAAAAPVCKQTALLCN